MKVGSLFTGYGGLDLAAEQVFGAHTVWTSDVDPGACKIIAHRWEDAPNLGDITKIDWSQVEPVDILTGGFPCQDLSMAGKRAGLRPGTRSGLWEHIAYAIDQLRPRYVIAENVRGLLSGQAHSDVEPCPWCMGDGPDGHMRALGAVLADLADLGYDTQWCGLRAADVGACHGRFRVFLLATDTQRREQREPAERRLWAESGDGATAATDTNGTAGRREAERIKRPSPPARTQPEAWSGAIGRSSGTRPKSLLPTPTRRDHKGHNQRRDATCLTGALLPTPRSTRGGSGTETMYGLGAARSDDQRPQGQVLLPTPSAADGIGGHERRGGERGTELLLAGIVKDARFGQYAEAIARWEPIIGRPAPDPTTNGRLNPAFVEWMQGLPAGWVTDVPGLTRANQLKALGNGVVPRQCEVALRHMLSWGSDHEGM